MIRITTKLRELLQKEGIIQVPTCFDPFSAKIAQGKNFRCIALGGYVMGANLCISEPLVSLEEVLRITRYITSAVNIPLIVDAGAGYGDPIHVVRTVKEFERAGAAGIHIEDQVFPKRVHYHKGIEHTVPVEEMVAKIKAAVKARTDKDFVIIARTDAMRTENYKVAIERANIYAEAGADMIMLFPNNMEELIKAPKDVKASLVYVNSEGNRFNRPVLSAKELEKAGYKMVLEAILSILVTYKAIDEAFGRLAEHGYSGYDPFEMINLRNSLEDTINLNDLYAIEQETTEKQ